MEKPILFNSEMVRAILEGRKTQTRRVIKPQPTDADYWTVLHTVGLRDSFYPNTIKATPGRLACPYGQPGDLLWVRETWATARQFNSVRPSQLDTDCSLWYRANKSSVRHLGARQGRWRPSIHMPRWASRLTLEVTGVRVERVQDISEADAGAEGVVPTEGQIKVCQAFAECRPDLPWVSPHQQAFCELWDSINAWRGYGWDVNPWVWVVEFGRA